MKNVRRLLIKLLTVAVVSFAAIGITACSGVTVQPTDSGGVIITPGVSSEASASDSNEEESVGGVDSSVSEEMPHEHDWNGYISKRATCEEDGEFTYSCACGERRTEVIAATGHVWNSYISKQATCEEDGALTYTCACGDSYTTVIAKTGHSWSEGYVSKQATCEEDGALTYTCACGDSYTTTIAKTGHSWSEGYVSKQATCTSDGVLAYTCYNCTVSNTVAIDKLNHSLQQYEAKAATCIEYGWNTYQACTREGCEYTTYKEIAATGHTFVRGVCSVSGCGAKEPAGDHVHEWDSGVVTTQATCIKKGVKTYTCWCNDSYTESIEALGHS